MRQDLSRDYSGISSETLQGTRGEKMGQNKKNSRIVNLLETYENRDFFYDRASHWEHSPLSIKDELMT